MFKLRRVEALPPEKLDIVEGNWIAYNGNPDRILKIQKLGHFHGLRFYEQTGIYGSMSLEDSKVTPIPLTVKIVQFFGFTPLRENIVSLNIQSKHGQEVVLHVKFETATPVLTVVDRSGNVRGQVVVKYLHSLQNEYFSVTNSELAPTIKRDDMRKLFNLKIF